MSHSEARLACPWCVALGVCHVGGCKVLSRGDRRGAKFLNHKVLKLKLLKLMLRLLELKA